MMHHHTRLGKLVCFIVGLLVSLTAIVVGLYAFNINVLALPFIQTNLHAVIRPLQIVIGVCGLLGLVCLFTCASESCKECEKHHTHGSHHTK